MSIGEALGRIDEISSRVSMLTGRSVAATPVDGTTATAASTTTSGDSPSFSEALKAASGSGTAAATAAAVTSTSSDISNDGIPATLQPLIEAAAKRNNLDPALVAAVAKAESGFRVDAGSGAGARGLMQLMPSTASGLGVTDILDPAQNLDAGSRYLKQQVDRFGDLRLALAAYNAGPGAVTRYGGVPPYTETQNYVTRVLGLYDQYRG